MIIFFNEAPKPDTVVFMAYKALDKYIEVSELRLAHLEKRFTAVEWEGTDGYVEML